MTIAGTTDALSELTFSPAPKNQDIEFILSVSFFHSPPRGPCSLNMLKEIRHYLSKDM